MKKAFTAIWIAVILLFVVSQIFLPSWAERTIEHDLLERAPGVTDLAVKVQAFPALGLLAGRAGGLEVAGQRLPVGSLVVDSFHLSAKELSFDPVGLLRGGVTVKDAASIQATAIIHEDDLSQFVWQLVPEIRSMHVRLSDGKGILSGPVHLLGARIDVNVSGYFRPRGRTDLVFVPQDVTVDQARVPDMLLNMIAQEFVLPLSLDELGLPLAIDDVRIEEGRLLLLWKLAM